MTDVGNLDQIAAAEKVQGKDVRVTEPLDIKDEAMDRDGAMHDNEHVPLSWKTWVVVFITCFGVMTQVYIVAPATVIAFIIRDVGDPALAGWIIQAPLLMQSTLSPIIGRLSDVADRKYLASIPPLIAFAGAVVSARAQSMNALIGGGILIGFTLSTISIIQAIPSEVLPMKHRPLAQGLAFIAGSFGGLLGVMGAGGLTNRNASGWRDVYWLQAALHLTTAIGLLLFYNPPRPEDRPKLAIGKIIWAMDPIGSALFITSTTLTLLALDWAGGSFPWHDPHVAAPLSIGLALLLTFCLYEWNGRDDGLVAHVFFRGSPNFILSVFAFSVEGWIFFSAVNTFQTLIVLNLGFESNSWAISKRQLSFNLVNIFASLPIIWYATKFKDMKLPLLISFTAFLVVSICYATITPAMNHAQIGYNVLSAIGQAGPLSLLVPLVQFTAPHRFLSTATGLAFSARAIGGAFGSAVLNVIANDKITATYASSVSAAALKAGLPSAQISTLLAALQSGNVTALSEISATNPAAITAATNASHNVYAAAYRLAWASIIPFVVLAMVAVACLKGVKKLMTEHVDAPIEIIPDTTGEKSV